MRGEAVLPLSYLPLSYLGIFSVDAVTPVPVFWTDRVVLPGMSHDGEDEREQREMAHVGELRRRPCRAVHLCRQPCRAGKEEAAARVGPTEQGEEEEE